jgi:hypothetical protein
MLAIAETNSSCSKSVTGRCCQNGQLFRQFMERNLRPDPVSDAIWNLPG